MADEPTGKKLHRPRVELKRSGDGAYQLLLDGQDVSKAVAEKGFAVEWDDHGQLVVTLRLVAHANVDIDLPDAVVRILDGQRAESSAADS